MNNTIIFLSLLIIFLSLVVDTNIFFKVDLLDDKFYVTVRIWNIKILKIDIDIWGLYYRVNNSKKIKKISDIFSKESNYFISQIKKSFLDKIFLSKIMFSSSVGFDNAFDAVNCVNFINLFCNTFSCLLSKDTDFVSINMPNYTIKNILLTLDLNIHFTIFDIVFASILCFYKRSRYVKEIRKQRT